MREFGDELTSAGFEDALFGVREGGEVRGGELVEGALEVVEARLDRGGRGAQGRGALFVHARQRGARIAQERFARGPIHRRAVGGEERLRLTRGEGVAFDGLGQPPLLGGGKDGQGAGQREGEAAAIDARAEFGRQPAREREAAIDPRRFLAQKFGDRGHGALVLVDEGEDHSGLVHGAGGLRGRVGLEKPRLHRRAFDRFENDGHFGAAFPSPSRQTFEAVEDLVGAARDGCHAQRHRGEVRGVGASPSQGRQRGAQPVDRNGDHVRGPSTGKIWKSG